MHTYQTLLEDLQKIGVPQNGTMLIHTSMKSIGEVEGGADTVLDVFMDYFRDEGTFAMPALSWILCMEKDPVFDVRNTPSCVGLLPELFRKREGVLRSCHPTHSVSAYGKGAKDLVDSSVIDPTPCGIHSPWHKLAERDATILQIGCDLTSCTFLHGVEEWANIEGRLDPPVEYTLLPYEGDPIRMQSQPHRGSPSEQFYRIEDDLIKGGALRFARFGNAKVYVLSAKKTCEVAMRVLRDKPRLFDE